MKKYIIILITLTILFSERTVSLQKSTAEKIDSVEAILPNLRGSERLETLRTLVRLAEYEPKRIVYVNMLLEEARRQKNIQEEGRALAILTEIYFSHFDTDSVFIAGEVAIRFTRQHKLYNHLFTVQQILIMRYEAQGQMLIALRKAEEAYAEAKELKEIMPMARLLAAMGGIYESMNQPEEALRCYEESLTLSLQNRVTDTFFYIEIYNFLATVAGRLYQHEETIRHADSLRIELYRFRQNNPETNLQNFDFLEQYHRVLAYSELNYREQAFEAVKKAEALFDSNWNETFYAALLDEIYIAYSLATANYEKAIEHINRAAQFYEDNNLEVNFLAKKINIAEVHFEKGDYKTAAENYRHIIQTKEQLNNELFYAQISELRTIYELDKTELESERQQAKIKQQRLWLIIIAIVCISLLLVTVLMVISRKRIYEKNKGLFKKIKEHDHLEEELENERKKNRNLQILSATVPVETAEEKEKKDTFQKLTELMKNEQLFTDSGIKREEVAKKIGMSDRALHDCLKNSIGMGFTDYLNHLRLLFARNLLYQRSANLTVEVVAWDSSFNSRTTFYRLFKEKFGMSPKEFRKIVMESDVIN